MVSKASIFTKLEYSNLELPAACFVFLDINNLNFSEWKKQLIGPNVTTQTRIEERILRRGRILTEF